MLYQPTETLFTPLIPQITGAGARWYQTLLKVTPYIFTDLQISEGCCHGDRYKLWEKQGSRQRWYLLLYHLIPLWKADTQFLHQIWEGSSEAHAKSRLGARAPSTWFPQHQYQPAHRWSHPAVGIWSDSDTGTWLLFSCVSQTLWSCILLCWLSAGEGGRGKMHWADSTNISEQRYTRSAAHCSL